MSAAAERFAAASLAERSTKASRILYIVSMSESVPELAILPKRVPESFGPWRNLSISISPKSSNANISCAVFSENRPSFAAVLRDTFRDKTIHFLI